MGTFGASAAISIRDVTRGARCITRLTQAEVLHNGAKQRGPSGANLMHTSEVMIWMIWACGNITTSIRIAVQERMRAGGVASNAVIWTSRASAAIFIAAEALHGRLVSVFAFIGQALAGTHTVLFTVVLQLQVRVVSMGTRETVGARAAARGAAAYVASLILARLARINVAFVRIKIAVKTGATIDLRDAISGTHALCGAVVSVE